MASYKYIYVKELIKHLAKSKEGIAGLMPCHQTFGQLHKRLEPGLTASTLSNLGLYTDNLKCYYDQKITFIFSSDFETMFVKHSSSEIIIVNFQKKTVNLNCNFPV